MNIDQQIRCVQDEVKRRHKAFPKLVESERITDEKAAYELAAMQAALETLTQLRGIFKRQ